MTSNDIKRLNQILRELGLIDDSDKDAISAKPGSYDLILEAAPLIKKRQKFTKNLKFQAGDVVMLQGKKALVKRSVFNTETLQVTGVDIILSDGTLIREFAPDLLVKLNCK